MKKIITKDKIIIGIFIIIIAIYGFWVNNMSTSNIENKKTTEYNENKNVIKAQINGEVKNPGLYELKNGSTLDDLVKKAGGLTDNADVIKLDLSQKLIDKIKIDIPSVSENTNNSNSTEIINNRININNASKEELMTLSGIGEVKAEAIIKYREITKFSKIEDIMNVKGVGEKTFESISDKIAVN